MLIARAIHSINPNAEFSIENDDINSITWTNGTTPISVEDIQAKMDELPTDEELENEKENLKASAKAKLIAGEPLTEEEADTIVL
jgi:hypothetical protein|tara:strand:- start:187 stop:441 length:255 start_codon:yes stop_codon:yes gene_type:complete